MSIWPVKGILSRPVDRASLISLFFKNAIHLFQGHFDVAKSAVHDLSFGHNPVAVISKVNGDYNVHHYERCNS